MPCRTTLEIGDDYILMRQWDALGIERVHRYHLIKGQEATGQQAQARMATFQFIEGWYNPDRRHSRLSYLSPVNFERAHEEAMA
jgi:transposase InsO family protein